MGNKIDGGVVSLAVPFTHILKSGLESGVLHRLIFGLSQSHSHCNWSLSIRGYTL